MIGYITEVALAIPFVGGLAALALNGRGKAAMWASAISLLIPLIIVPVAVLAYGSYYSPSIAMPGLGYFQLVLDGLNWPVALGIAVVTFLISIYSWPYMNVRFEELGRKSWGLYYFLYTYFSAGMLGIVLSNNFILFYIFLELSLITSFLLIALYGYGNRQRISFIYLIWTHLGGFMFLIGGFIYGFVLHTFNFIPVPPGISSLGYLIGPVVLLITLGLLIKMAVFGVHVWLPYAHAEAPTPVSALLSPAMIGIGGYAIIRIDYFLFRGLLLSYRPLLIALSVVTIIYGGLMALKENDFKRLLAYSSVAQMGYMLMGIATLTPLGIVGAILQFFAHAVGKSILFSSSGVLIAKNNNLRDINKMGGLAKSMPYTSALALLGFMDISGLPPTFGFFSKLFILIAVGEVLVGMGWGGIALLAFVLIGFGLTPAYSFVAMKRIFFGPQKLKAVEGDLMMLVPMAIIAAIMLIAFAFPGLLFNPLSAYVKQLVVMMV